MERDHPNASDAEKYRLAQADTLMRLFKVSSLQELEKMAGSPGSDAVIEKHNAELKNKG